MADSTKTRNDVYQEITDQMIAMLEAGTRPWSQSWIGAPLGLPKRGNGENYRGINVLSLWVSAMRQLFTSSTWLTFKQARALGGAVRKGEKGTVVVYCNRIQCSGENEDEENPRSIPFLKRYVVFNVDQIDGIEAHFPKASAPAERNPDQRCPVLDQAFARVEVDVRHGGARAFYDPATDYVQMPDFEAFFSAEDYYSVLSHELCHATGHHSRLDRDSLNGTTKADYARDELVSELGSAFVGGVLEFKVKDREDHAAYLASWLEALKNDKRAIFRAATQAQAAADYLLGMMKPE